MQPVPLSETARQIIGQFNIEVAAITNPEELKEIIVGLDDKLSPFQGDLDQLQKEQRQFFTTMRRTAQHRLEVLSNR